MPTAPTLANVKAYLGTQHSWTDAQITSALASETAAQLAVCALPADADPEAPGPYPDDLAEALCRRVAHNLAVREVPLGVQAAITDTASAVLRVGGTDAEVRRLEGPYRRLVLG